MARYEENAYNWLKRNGLADKYEHAGIYCIKIDETTGESAITGVVIGSFRKE